MSRPSFGELAGRDPYEILELASGASDADVRLARKRLLRRYHPDLPSGDLARTQLITAAADLLLDPIRRTGYYDLREREAKQRAARPTAAETVWFAGPRPGKPPSGPRPDDSWSRPGRDGARTAEQAGGTGGSGGGRSAGGERSPATGGKRRPAKDRR